MLLRDIRLESNCEHHMAPIIGRVHVAYLPHRRVVGISKLARVVEAYAKRLQIQEKLTAQIANTIQDVLQPRGVAVVIEAAHQCMTTRGVHKPGVTMVTSRMLGAFRDDADDAARTVGDDRQPRAARSSANSPDRSCAALAAAARRVGCGPERLLTGGGWSSGVCCTGVSRGSGRRQPGAGCAEPDIRTRRSCSSIMVLVMSYNVVAQVIDLARYGCAHTWASAKPAWVPSAA